MNITELGKKHDIGTQLAGRIRGEIEQRFQQDKQNAQKWVLDWLLQHGKLTEEAYTKLKTEYSFGDEVIHDIHSTKQAEFKAIYQKGSKELKDYLYTQGSLQSIYAYVQTEYGFGDPVLRQICQELDEQFQLDQAQSQQDIHHIIAAHGPLSSDAIAAQLRQQNCLFGDAVVQVLIQKVVEARQAAYQVYRRAYAEAFRRAGLLLSEEDKQSLERKRQQDGITLSDQEVKVITEEYESALSQYREQYRSILYRYDLSDRSCLELEDSERAELEQRRLALKLETEDVQFVEQQKIEQYRLDLRGYEQMLNEALQRQVTLDERDRKSLEDYRREHHLERQIVDRIEARLLQPTESFEKDIRRLVRHQHGQVVATEGLTAQVLEAIEQRRLAYNVTAQNAEALQHKVLDEYQNDLAIYRRAVAEALPTDLLLLLQVTRGQLDDLRRELDLSASATAKIEAEFADAIAHYRECYTGLLQNNSEVTDEVLQGMTEIQQMLNLGDEIVAAIKVEVEQTLYQKQVAADTQTTLPVQPSEPPTETSRAKTKATISLPKVPISTPDFSSIQAQISHKLSTAKNNLPKGKAAYAVAGAVAAVGVLAALALQASEPIQLSGSNMPSLAEELGNWEGTVFTPEFLWTKAQELKQVGHRQRPIHLLKLIPEDSELYADAQAEILALQNEIWKMAKARYEAGEQNEAIMIAKSIQLGSPHYEEAQTTITSWEEAWETDKPKADQIIELAESTKWDDWMTVRSLYGKLTNPHWKNEAESVYQEIEEKIVAEQERIAKQQVPSVRNPPPGAVTSTGIPPTISGGNNSPAIRTNLPSRPSSPADKSSTGDNASSGSSSDWSVGTWGNDR